jgi:nucleotide-binding universal stress UspA family protein
MAKTNSAAPVSLATAVVGLKRLLVTTDFSEVSRQALPFATSLARQFGATLTLVHVVPTTLPAELSHLGIVLEQKRLVAEAGSRLAQFRERELPANLAVETVLLEGGPPQEITRFAAETGVDLILTATHGHTGLKHVWLGSTAERVVRQAPCPVLVVPAPAVPVRFPNDIPCRFQHLVVPTDFSQMSREALSYAAAWARPCGSEMTLVHTIEPPPYPEFGYAHIPTKEARLKRKARQKLEEYSQELNHVGIKAACVIRTGSAFHEIVALAREESADLIVIATHGRQAIAHALLGSTAERVVRHAPCPVLVVRERGRQFIAT